MYPTKNIIVDNNSFKDFRKKINGNNFFNTYIPSKKKASNILCITPDLDLGTTTLLRICECHPSCFKASLPEISLHCLNALSVRMFTLREGWKVLSFSSKVFPKGLFEILHFYSTSVCHPLSSSSVLKLEGWNFAHRLLIFMPKKLLTRFWIFV